MNVVLYLRVSGHGQIAGDGFPRQEESARAYAAAHSLNVLQVFREEGVSGTVEGMDRPAFVEAVQFLKDSGGGIVVERLDRLARDLMVQELLLAECRKMGLQVFAADQPALIDMACDGDDPTRKLIRQIMGALAEWEKSMLVKKLAIARARVRKEKGRCEGFLPFGEAPEDFDRLVELLRYLHGQKQRGFSWRRIAVLAQISGFRNRWGEVFDRETLSELYKKYRKHLPD